MAIEKIWGTQTEKRVLSESFVSLLDSFLPDAMGTVYLSFPIITQKQSGIDAFLLLDGVCPIAVAFDNATEVSDKTEFRKKLDEYFSTLEGKFKICSDLREGRDLKFPIKTICYFPNINHKIPSDKDVDYVTANQDISKIINDDGYKYTYENDLQEKIESVLQNLSSLSMVGSEENDEDNLYSKIKNIKASMASFDRAQKKIAIETYDGVQRIRGLAGTGKTIILAWKAAYLHVMNPNWDIAVTFKSRSLKDMYKEYIYKFCIGLADKQPNFKKVHIINTWGGTTDQLHNQGLYYRYCKIHDIQPLNFTQAQAQAQKGGGNVDPFDYACQQALLKTKDSSKKQYDAILVDEGQDCPTSFLRMSYKFLRKPKRLIFAYDDWQNLENRKIPSLKKIFDNRVKVREDKYGRNPDLMLNVCYRTPRPILVVAHGLGCGIYNEKGIIQMLEPATYWEKLGYKNKTSRLEKGRYAFLYRDDNTSPQYLEKISSKDDFTDILDFARFDNLVDMSNQVYQKIKYYLKEGIPKEEIMIITPDSNKIERGWPR